ncbi:MAG: hypothetical protein U1E91_01290 [Moraxella sp.]
MLITSKDNPTIKTVHALLTGSRQRKKLGKTVIEGTHLLESVCQCWPISRPKP